MTEGVNNILNKSITEKRSMGDYQTCL